MTKVVLICVNAGYIIINKQENDECKCNIIRCFK